MKRKNLNYIIFFFISLSLSWFRIKLISNINEYGLVHKPVEINVIYLNSFSPILEGYVGSMILFMALGVNLLTLLYYIYTKGQVERTKLNLVFLVFSLSLLVFEETILRLLGGFILLNSIMNLTKNANNTID